MDDRLTIISETRGKAVVCLLFALRCLDQASGSFGLRLSSADTQMAAGICGSRNSSAFRDHNHLTGCRSPQIKAKSAPSRGIDTRALCAPSRGGCPSKLQTELGARQSRSMYSRPIVTQMHTPVFVLGEQFAQSVSSIEMFASHMHSPYIKDKVFKLYLYTFPGKV